MYMYTHTLTRIYTHSSLYRRSLSLIESLLQLSEQGHYEEVMNILYTPMNKCPEILFLGLIKAKVRRYPYNHGLIGWCMSRCLKLVPLNNMSILYSFIVVKYNLSTCIQVSGGPHEPYQWRTVQQEVINQVLPVFIANHPTYSPVLYDAWHSSVSDYDNDTCTSNILHAIINT